MKIEYIQPGNSYINWSIGGIEGEYSGESIGGRGIVNIAGDSILTIGSLSFNLVDLQKDFQVIIDITKDGENIYEGIDGKDGYIANIILPPSRYVFIDTNETDESGAAIFDLSLLPIDLSTVTLKLWPTLIGSFTE